MQQDETRDGQSSTCRLYRVVYPMHQLVGEIVPDLGTGGELIVVEIAIDGANAGAPLLSIVQQAIEIASSRRPDGMVLALVRSDAATSATAAQSHYLALLDAAFDVVVLTRNPDNDDTARRLMNTILRPMCDDPHFAADWNDVRYIVTGLGNFGAPTEGVRIKKRGRRARLASGHGQGPDNTVQAAEAGLLALRGSGGLERVNGALFHYACNRTTLLGAGIRMATQTIRRGMPPNAGISLGVSVDPLMVDGQVVIDLLCFEDASSADSFIP